MKIPLRILTHVALLTLLLVFAVTAQEQDKPMPDRWRGLIIDESTPEDAVKILGQPKKDALSKMDAPPVGHWLSKIRKEKVFRMLEFSKPEGVDKASLFFYEGKLVSILLDVKKGIEPVAMANIYGITFEPIFGQADLAFSPRDFERNQGKVYAKTFPTVYYLAGVSEKTFILAGVSNVPSFGGALARSAGVPDKPGSLPGKVEGVQIVSRKLENRDGADALK